MTSTINYKTKKSTWGTALRLDEALWRLRLRHPPGPGRSRIIINTYVYFEGDTLAVIDPGWPGTVEQLDQALRELKLGAGISRVDSWLYTHAHIDHMGAAALLGAQSDAPHIAWRGLKPHIHRWHSFQDELHDWRPWTAQAFAEPHRSRLLNERKSHRLREFYGPGEIPRPEFIDFGDTIQIGELSLEFLDARGHDPHHGVFFSAERGWLFSGDLALSVPTPICRAMGDSLAKYRQSLARISKLQTRLLLPGHGLHRREKIEAAFERAAGFLTYYHRATRRALEQRSGPAGLYEIGLLATPKSQELEPREHWWVHLALVDSHLHEMVAQGSVELVDEPDGPRYRLL